MKSKRSGRDLLFMKTKCDDVKEAEALIWGGGGGEEGFVCQKTGIIFRVEKFRTTPSIQQCFKGQRFGHKEPNCTKKQKLLCVVKLIRTKPVLTKKKEIQNVQIVRDLMSPTAKAVLLTRIKSLGNM